ncbi:MAG TPA: DUF1365 family protein [Marmoricola sp.]
MTRREIAVVGSGVSGLVAAHELARTTRVTLYEADDRLGGHADTHTVTTARGEVAIDTGFIVHNDRTYPILTGLFAELGVRTQASDMSMSVRDETTGVEYAGALGARGLFASRRSRTDPRHWRMLIEIRRFHRRARALLAEPTKSEQTLGEFLDDADFSAYFRRHFVVPLVACVWSCDPDVARDYPARYLFTFLDHHGMLAVFGSPAWRTVTGGSREYVRRIAARLDEVFLDTKVVEIAETAGGVRITDGGGAERTFDGVVVAAHPDQALAMLATPTAAQREVLGSFRYSSNLAQLHTDVSLLPRSRAARASWNYQQRSDGRASITYDLTRLMRLPGHDDHTGDPTRYLVTLNGSDLIDPRAVITTREYSHPIYDPTSVAAQQRLGEIGTDRIAFAGAYHGWGFHEDGARSGMAAAHRLGACTPVDPTPRTPLRYRTTIKHARTGPVRHAFSYRSSSWLVDLDHLPARGFEARDHLGDPALTLRANLDAFLAEHGVVRPARIRMLAHPRSLGHVFNPISVFWCDDADGRRLAVVIEVHNTYGGRHAYLVHPDPAGHAEVGKELYVSPFNDTDGHYAVAVPEPGERVHVAVTLHHPGRPAFVATLNGVAVPGARLRPSLSTHLVAWRIRKQGIRLWLRGLKVQPRQAQR